MRFLQSQIDLLRHSFISPVPFIPLNTLQSGSWPTVQSGIAGTGAIIQVNDVGAAAQSRLFYRIVLLP